MKESPSAWVEIFLKSTAEKSNPIVKEVGFYPIFAANKKNHFVTMRRCCTLILLICLGAGCLYAQVPSGYYNNAAGKTGDELKIALHDIIKGHTTISYSNLWNAFWSTDNKGNGVVWDMYSDIPGGTPPYTYYHDQDKCDSDGCDDENGCYNREHSWPKSWFNNQTTPECDLHHIFPTDCYVNQKRSNYPFGEVQRVTWTSQNGSKLGTCKSSLGYSGDVFEPIDEYKGDFARAIMYMSVRYYSEDSNWGTSGMTDKSVIKDWAIAMLLDWNEQDPVSQKEIDRNKVIYNDYQHNRNPFVDHPEYARMIWDENWSGTYYTITIADCENGSVCSDVGTALAGQTVTLTAEPNEGYVLDAWNVYKTGNAGITVNVSGNTFTMPAYGVTVSATFVESSGSGNGGYVKVTSAPTDWSGEYLIVYEGGNVAFDGSLTTLDASGNVINVTINDNTIEANETTNAAKFIIAAITGGYSIQSASGYYIGQTSNANGLLSSTTITYTNTITYENGNINILSSGGAYLRFNDGTNNGNRFRYYKSSTYTNQKAIQLYKKEEGSNVVTQDVSLVQGWNWWAPTVQTSLADLTTALGTNHEIKSFDGTDVTELVLGQMYKIHVTANHDFTLSGTRPASSTVNINRGLNGFGCMSTIAIINLGIDPATGDKIISQDEGFAIFENGEWNGSLETLVPGKGYLYYSNDDNSKTLTLE